jgi:hypothetical protein
MTYANAMRYILEDVRVIHDLAFRLKSFHSAIEELIVLGPSQFA